MRDRRHTWHVHMSFHRSAFGAETLGWWHRLDARDARGNHGVVKHHRDWMRHYAKREARGL